MLDPKNLEQGDDWQLMQYKDIGTTQKVMKTWPNVNNCKEYAPFFILYLDCVHQLIQMNPYSFEFTPHYLAHIGFNCYTNKYYETLLPLSKTEKQSGQKLSIDEEALVSLF